DRPGTEFVQGNRAQSLMGKPKQDRVRLFQMTELPLDLLRRRRRVADGEVGSPRVEEDQRQVGQQDNHLPLPIGTARDTTTQKNGRQRARLVLSKSLNVLHGFPPRAAWSPGR